MISLRRATAGDEAPIARVNVEAWQQAYGVLVPRAMADAVTVERRQPMWRALIGRYEASHPTWVAIDDAAGVVGFATGSAEGGTVEGYPGEVHMLYVAPGFQRRDVGRRLFHVLADGLVASGGTAAVATVLDAPSALGFCTALGGLPVAWSDIDIAGTPVAQTLFAWPDLAALQPGS